MPSNNNRNVDRENVGRIDHIILIYKNEENQLKAKQQFTETLGIKDWQEVGQAEQGLSIIISWDSGIELVYPTDDNPAYQKHLEKHGEGFYGMVFGFVMSVPVGPVNVICLQRTLYDRGRHGFIIGLGAALGDAFYGFLAAFGLNAIHGLIDAYNMELRIFGAVIMGVFWC